MSAAKLATRALGLGLAFSLVQSAPAAANLIATSRLSLIRSQSTNFDTPIQEVQTADLAATFDKTLMGALVNTEPGGALNTGGFHVSQTAIIVPDGISIVMAQNATTETDHGSPQFNQRSEFEYVFSVDVDTEIVLDGVLVGSSTIGADDFARVRLIRDVVSIFPGTFPFATTLTPGHEYTLSVQITGRARPNDSSASSADVTLAIVPEPISVLLLATGLLGLAAYGRRS